MSIIEERLRYIDTLTLGRGSHSPPSNGMVSACVMEATAYVSGEGWSDHPECVSPVIGAFLRSWNDSLTETDRQLLKPRVTVASRTWVCPRVGCGHRNEWRGSSRKCQGCGQITRRKKRVPKHAEVLRDTPYEAVAALSVAIHGGEREACGVCGKPKGENRRHDRDHDHRTGLMRGLACFHCNRELLRNATLEQARAVVAYLERVETYARSQ